MDLNIAPEAVYSESPNSDQGANNIIPFPIQPPGTIVPYSLPDEVERPFEPISACAIAEIGTHAELTGYTEYPLNEEALKDLLKQKIDGRVKGRRIMDVIGKYTDNPQGAHDQLKAVKKRIEEITTSEKDANKVIKTRIQNHLERALERNLNPGQLNSGFLRRTLAAREALRDVGSQGPLDADELFRFIDTATGDNLDDIPKVQLLNQVRDLRLNIGDRTDEGNHERQLPLKRINKAIEEILKEISRY